MVSDKQFRAGIEPLARENDARDSFPVMRAYASTVTLALIRGAKRPSKLQLRSRRSCVALGPTQRCALRGLSPACNADQL